MPVSRATPFFTSTLILASLRPERVSSAFLTSRSMSSSRAFTSGCFAEATTWSSFTTRRTPLTLRASASAAAFAALEGTMPNSVTTPRCVSTLMSRAGVLLSANRRSLVAEVM